MDTSDLVIDHFERIRELYVGTVDDLDPETAHHRPGGTGNPIVWLLWHTARVQDDHVAGLSGATQAWHDGWSERFGFPFDDGDIGYGHSSDDVDAVRVERLPRRPQRRDGSRRCGQHGASGGGGSSPDPAGVQAST